MVQTRMSDVKGATVKDLIFQVGKLRGKHTLFSESFEGVLLIRSQSVFKSGM